MAGFPRVPHPSATRTPEGATFDLHALGTPPALILSQDQTLHQLFRAPSQTSQPGSTRLCLRYPSPKLLQPLRQVPPPNESALDKPLLHLRQYQSTPPAPDSSRIRPSSTRPLLPSCPCASEYRSGEKEPPHQLRRAASHKTTSSWSHLGSSWTIYKSGTLRLSRRFWYSVRIGFSSSARRSIGTFRATRQGESGGNFFEVARNPPKSVPVESLSTRSPSRTIGTLKRGSASSARRNPHETDHWHHSCA